MLYQGNSERQLGEGKVSHSLWRRHTNAKLKSNYDPGEVVGVDVKCIIIHS